MRHLAIMAVAVGAPLAAQASAPVPVAMIGDPQSLRGVVSFAPPDPALRRFGASRVVSRIDVDLPGKLRLKRADLVGYAPIVLELTDGRCFRIDLPRAGLDALKVPLAEERCPQDRPAQSTPLSPPRARLRYVGKAWNLHAWADPRSGRTLLVREGKTDAPVLTTIMRVVALDGIGSPDTPRTEVSLVGYFDGRLIIATVSLTLP